MSKMDSKEFLSKCQQMSNALRGLGFPSRLSYDRDGTFCTFVCGFESMSLYNHPTDGVIMCDRLDLTRRVKESDEFLKIVE